MTMQTVKIILMTGLVISLFGCSQNREQGGGGAMADSAAKSFISSSAAVENNKDSVHRFIRTANLKFKAKSVIKATYHIEDITNQQGGFVTLTKLTSNIDNFTTIPVSADSSVETTYYTVSNSMTLRVPNTKLDTTLKLIAQDIDYLDFRIIKAEDVSLQILSNSLTQQRAAKNEERLTNALDKKGKVVGANTTAREVLSSKQEQGDNAKISNLSLLDQIQFSTVNLIIYQQQTIKREIVSNHKNIDAYEPSFWGKILEALKFGWNILEAFIVFLVRLWGFFLFGLGVFFLYKKFGYKFRKWNERQ